MTKCFVVFSASEAERTISFCQPGDPTVQTEVAHQSNVSMSAGNQVRINIGNSLEHTWRNIFKTSSSYIHIRITQSIFILRIFLIFVYFIFLRSFSKTSSQEKLNYETTIQNSQKVRICGGLHIY